MGASFMRLLQLILSLWMSLFLVLFCTWQVALFVCSGGHVLFVSFHLPDHLNDSLGTLGEVRNLASQLSLNCTSQSLLDCRADTISFDVFHCHFVDSLHGLVHPSLAGLGCLIRRVEEIKAVDTSLLLEAGISREVQSILLLVHLLSDKLLQRFVDGIMRAELRCQ